MPTACWCHRTEIQHAPENAGVHVSGTPGRLPDPGQMLLHPWPHRPGLSTTKRYDLEGGWGAGVRPEVQGHLLESLAFSDLLKDTLG